MLLALVAITLSQIYCGTILKLSIRFCILEILYYPGLPASSYTSDEKINFSQRAFLHLKSLKLLLSSDEAPPTSHLNLASMSNVWKIMHSVRSKRLWSTPLKTSRWWLFGKDHLANRKLNAHPLTVWYSGIFLSQIVWWPLKTKEAEQSISGALGDFQRRMLCAKRRILFAIFSIY